MPNERWIYIQSRTTDGNYGQMIHLAKIKTTQKEIETTLRAQKIRWFTPEQGIEGSLLYTVYKG